LTVPDAPPDAPSAIPALDDTATTLWAACEASSTSWDDQTRHDKFVKYCSAAGLLAAAARQYRAYLEQHPDDLTASKMQQRIVNMATMLLSTQKPAKKPVTSSRGFIIVVGLAALAGIIGAILYGR
jgi:hypothetical protein